MDIMCEATRQYWSCIDIVAIGKISKKM